MSQQPHAPQAGSHNNAAAPRARKAGLVVQRLGDELLVYDLDKHKAHRLNKTAAQIWRLCDGQRTVADIARRLSADVEAPTAEALVQHALEQLGRNRLLQTAEAAPAAANLSRRRFLRKAAVIGGASLLVPVVSSLVAPTPAQAQTACGALRQPCCTGDVPACNQGLSCLNGLCEPLD